MAGHLMAAEKMAACISSGNKILIFGNGGSAADAQHLAAEFVNRFKIERPPLAALALTTDTSILTSIGNDYHFSDVFSKQIEALGKKNDIAWGLSTSGNSKNVIQAIKAANAKKLFSIANELRIAGDYLELAKAFESELEKSLGKKLPINVDGAIAALLCEMDFDVIFANAFFMIARVPGLVAHIYEEKTRYKPMRKIDPTDVTYDGPEDREI